MNPCDDCRRACEIPCWKVDHGLLQPVEWISVKDRLPEKPMRCLVYTMRGEYGGYEITFYNEGFYVGKSCVTHWMPLPEPPK